MAVTTTIGAVASRRKVTVSRCTRGRIAIRGVQVMRTMDEVGVSTSRSTTTTEEEGLAAVINWLANEGVIIRRCRVLLKMALC